MTRRVIFPPPDYWTQTTEHTMTDNTGRITGLHAHVTPDVVLTPTDGIGTFFNAQGDMIGVGLILTDETLGTVLIPITGRNITGLHGLLDWLVQMKDHEIDQLLARIKDKPREDDEDKENTE